MRRSFKPDGMSDDEYRDFVAVNPPERCQHCGEKDVETLVADHIIPRTDGGTNDFRNLQWLCVPCNSRKQGRPDGYWSKTLPFDAMPDLDALRTSQKAKCWDLTLSHAEYFSKSISLVSHAMLVFAWIVGAGKTLAMLVFACAVNAAIRLHRGMSYPRIDRILILVPSRAIRSQTCKQLRKLGKLAFPTSPAFRVNEIKEGSILDTDSYIKNHDIHVACINMLFSQNGEPRPNLTKVLQNFGMICFDEIHIAQEQVKYIVGHAGLAVVAGFTCTPIEANGDLMKHMVLYSHWGYDEADQFDAAMKYINEQCFIEIKPSTLGIHVTGKMKTVESIPRKDHHKQLVTEMEVVRAVLEWMVCSDRTVEDQSLWEPAPHRDNKPIGHTFYDHPMIVVESRFAAKELCRQTNEIIKRNPHLYPASKGYGAEYAVIPDNDEKFEGKPLDERHPWLLASNAPDHGIQPGSRRILFVCEMGREGLDNPLCCTEGVAKPDINLREVIQRVIGRAIRSCSKDGLFPPGVLDRVRVITHSTYGLRPKFLAALDYIKGSASYFEDMRTIEDVLQDGMPDMTSVPRPERKLPRDDKIKIVQTIGDQLNKAKSPHEIDVDSIVDEFGGQSPERRADVQDWVETVIERTEEARNRLNLQANLEEIPRVIEERIPDQPSDSDLVNFIKREHQELLVYVPRIMGGDAMARDFALSLYRRYRSQFLLPSLAKSQETINTIKAKIGTRIIEALTIDKPNRSQVYKMTGRAIREILGAVKTGEELVNGGVYDTPICHAILARPRVLADIMGFVLNHLINTGKCPALAAALKIDPDSVPLLFDEDDSDAA